jgi:hypothetical protein
MRNTIEILNELEKNGIVERYAIGGGFAVLFYAEPVLTYDLDVFCFVGPGKDKIMVTLEPIYEYLGKKGYKADLEHIVIEEMPVQFIPAYNDLVVESVREAREVDYEDVKVKVVRLEHLLAIMLQTNRPKDRERILLLIDETKIDEGYFNEILKRHDLVGKWKQLLERYGEK